MNNKKAIRKKSAFQQFGILILRQFYILKANIKKLLMIIGLPVATALIIFFVTGDKMYESYDDTKAILFAMVCVAIWIGLFNSIHEVCQERGILKREYMANLKLSAYIGSKIAVQAVICILQTAVFLIICAVTIGLPESGIIFENPFFEMYTTLFLVMLSSDAMGLLVSSLVKTADMANIISPVLLLLQLVMSGVLFKLEGATEWLSYLTMGKWGVEGLGSIANLNNLETNLILEADEGTRDALKDMVEREAEDIFNNTADHLLMTWLIIAALAAVFCIVSAIVLRKIAKDSR